VSLTVGGHILDYSCDVATSTADITTLKILINSTLSTKDAAMMMMDIKNYYLGTPLPRFEYMKMPLSRFPKEIIQNYNLNALAVDGWVYIEIRKGMYGLKQSGLLANQLLQTRMAPLGTTQPGTPRTMVTQNSPYLFHAHCQRFRSQIRRQEPCRASPERPFTNI
jgi:hypothetical protein